MWSGICFTLQTFFLWGFFPTTMSNFEDHIMGSYQRPIKNGLLHSNPNSPMDPGRHVSDSHIRPGQPHQVSASANLHSLMEAEEAMLRSWDQGFINSLLLANSSISSSNHHGHNHNHKWKHVKRDKAFYLDPAKSKSHFLPAVPPPSVGSSDGDHSPSHNKFTFHRAPKPMKGRYFVVVTSPRLGNGEVTSNQTAMNQEEHVAAGPDVVARKSREGYNRRKGRNRRHHHHHHHHREYNDQGIDT